MCVLAGISSRCGSLPGRIIDCKRYLCSYPTARIRRRVADEDLIQSAAVLTTCVTGSHRPELSYENDKGWNKEHNTQRHIAAVRRNDTAPATVLLDIAPSCWQYRSRTAKNEIQYGAHHSNVESDELTFRY